ncbi:HAD family hydrolase [Pokkaliibacter sp. CJK22405]|uniref:HAD family hydrolase n=1 Tax=Pokkaliibacter sp. CJK22405 TaxID=3384615 RepID=UPI0039848A7C
MMFAIFDMDGLLIDSEPHWLDIEGAVMKRHYGLDVPVDTFKSMQGMSTTEIGQRLSEQYPQAFIEPPVFVKQIQEAMRLRLPQIPMMKGARELMKYVAENGYSVAIASSSPLDFIQTVVRENRLAVDVLVSGYEVPRSKPDPAVFLLAAERLRADPAECLVWEDSVNGVKAGVAAGMKVIAIPDPHTPWPEAFSIASYRHANLHESLSALKAGEYQ